MFFKGVSLLVVSLVLNACGWTQDKPKGAQNFQTKKLDLSCLQVAPVTVQKLFNGELTSSAEDVAQEREIWQCLDLSLNTFSSKTKGSNSDYYTAEELQSFANRYLPANQLFTMEFLKSVFRLKMEVIGGDEFKLTQSEIVALRGKIARFGEVIEPLAPYINVLLLKDGPDSPAKLEASNRLNQFLTGLAHVLENSAASVKWASVNDFIAQLEHYTNKGQPSALTLVREQADIYRAIKLMVVGGSENLIEREKWSPIFQSISQAYNAIFLTSTSSSALERLGIEVGSTAEEQQRAVNLLKETFLRLKADPTLSSQHAITQMSDRFAKILIVSGFIFPSTRGTLAIKEFLGDANIRKLAGEILELLPRSRDTVLAPSQIRSIADRSLEFLEQAALISRPEIPVGQASVSFTAVEEDINTLAPYFETPAEKDALLSGLSALKKGIPLLIGKSGNELSIENLKQLVGKSLDLYFTWTAAPAKSINENIGNSLDIFLRSPSVDQVQIDDVLSAIADVRVVITQLKLPNQIEWDLLIDNLKKGMKIKAALFQSSDQSISNEEISRASYLWTPFRKNQDLGAAFNELAPLLADKPFGRLEIEDLVPLINAMIPPKPGHKGLDFKTVGDLKLLLVGGSARNISPPEYSLLAHTFSVLYGKLYAKVSALPKDFAPGLDSTTFELASAFIDAFAAARTSDVPLKDLRTLFLDVTESAGYQVRNQTVDDFLIGFYTRLFNHSKGAKPGSINGLVVKPAQLKMLIPLFDEIKNELVDSERAFAGLDPKTQTLSRATLLSRLKDNQNRVVTSSIQPLLDGDNHLFHLPKKHAINDQFYLYDIAYKAAIYSVINWIIPFYKIENDPAGNKKRLTLSDLTDLLTDIGHLVYDLRLSLSDTPAETTATARMLNMNLFTQVGNGDNYMDPLEATEFLTFTSGGIILLERVENELFTKCFPGITDFRTVKSIPYQCLTKVFFAKSTFKSIYADVAPQLVEQYVKWNADDLEIYRQGALSSTRPGWTEDGRLPIGDFESLVALPYFVENIFERFDRDQDDILRFSELMNAFPIFCQQISDAGGGKLKGSCVPGEDPRQIEAIYGYLIINGHAPEGTEPGNSVWRRLRAGIQVLKWFRYWNNLDRNPAVRDREPPFMGRQDLLAIVANLAASAVDSGSYPLPGPEQLESIESSP